MRKTIITALAAVALSASTALATAPGTPAMAGERVPEKRFECQAPEQGQSPRECAGIDVKPGQSVEIANRRSQKQNIVFMLRTDTSSKAIVEKELGPKQTARVWTNKSEEKVHVSLYLKSTDRKAKVRGKITPVD